jgi:CBS domain-containing protein
MLARELARSFPTVELDSSALEAARLLAEQRLPGLIVLGSDGLPHTVLPGSQVLRFLVPAYVQDDPALARAFDEKSADQLSAKLRDQTVRDLLPQKPERLEIPWVEPDATAVEIAALMTGMRSPIVAVVHDGELIGAVTISALLDHLLAGSAAS